MRWTLLLIFAAILVAGKLLAMSMQRNGPVSYGEAVIHASDGPRCRVCARYTSRELVDAYGTPTCEACLRRIDADPREKRRFMFAMSEAAYW